MNASTRIGRDAVALALGAIVFPACVTRTFQHAIEVKRGSTVEEKLAIAKAIVTEQRLARLREELKARLPGTTDQQLARLGLRWNVAADGRVGRCAPSPPPLNGSIVRRTFESQPLERSDCRNPAAECVQKPSLAALVSGFPVVAEAGRRECPRAWDPFRRREQ